MVRFWVGGYGPDMDGIGTGIGFLAGDEGDQTALQIRGVAAEVASPSWLAQHPSLDIVYAALEGQSTVQAFVRSGDATLAALGEPVEAGQYVCHLAVAPSGGYLIASCYGDGRVVRIGIDGAGRLVPDAAHKAAELRSALFGEPLADTGAPAGTAAAASDPYASTDAERVSHAHAAAFLADGRIATTDLGFDLVRIWRVSSAGLQLDHEVVLPIGVGPRHMVVHPSGHLHVVTEYSCEVFTLAAAADGTYGVVSSALTSPIAEVGVDFPAELARTRDGQFLYTALRGSNTIAALRVRGAGESLEPMALADSGVDWPRHHVVHEGKLVVAGQRSDTISLVDLDERTGAPLGIRHRASAPTPTHLLRVR